MAPTAGEIFAGISAVAGLGATFFAAYTAHLSLRSAKASEEAVKEAVAARTAQIAPRLVLEKDFLDLQLAWDRNSGQGPSFLARESAQSGILSPPTFSLTNHGGGPAIEIQIEFELEDPNSDLDVPDVFKHYGLSVSDEPASENQPAFQVLNFSGRNGGGVVAPLYRKVTTDVINCAQGETRTVYFSAGLSTRIFLRGLQHWVRRLTPQRMQPLTLTVRVSCHSIEGDRVETQFRFNVNPFFQGDYDPLPLTTYSHFDELPMFSRRQGPRVE